MYTIEREDVNDGSGGRKGAEDGGSDMVGGMKERTSAFVSPINRRTRLTNCDGRWL